MLATNKIIKTYANRKEYKNDIFENLSLHTYCLITGDMVLHSFEILTHILLQPYENIPRAFAFYYILLKKCQ